MRFDRLDLSMLPVLNIVLHVGNITHASERLDVTLQMINVDEAWHELGTAFNLVGRGFVMIGSCSHRGIINTVWQAQAVSGIDKVHAVVGGFHLVPTQTRDQSTATPGMMQALNPDYVIPGHCTGEAFIAAALAAMS